MTGLEETDALEARRARLAEKGGGSLRSYTAGGMMINAAFNIGLRGLSFIRGFLVAIFLTPADYGLWAVIILGYTALGRLKQVGIVDKYIQQDEPDDELAFQRAFTLDAILSVGVVLFLAAMTPILAVAFDAPDIIAPGFVLLVAYIGVIFHTPLWTFQREMDFRKQRTLASVDPLVGIVVTVAMAAGGAGYWAFAGGSVAGAWAGALVIMRFSPHPVRFRYDAGTARQYIRFSVPLLFSNLSNTILLLGTSVVARFTVGLSGMGAMSLSNSIRLYAEFANGIIGTTMYPAICAIKDKRDLLFESFVKSNRLALMWGFPVGIGVTLFSDDLLTFVIGREWSFGVILFQCMGIVAAVGHIGFNWGEYVRALGDTKPIARYAWTTLLGWAAGPIPLMLTHGLEGYAVGLFGVALLTLWLRGHYIRKIFPRFSMVRHAGRAIVPTIPAVLVVLAVRSVESGDRTLAIALGEIVLYLGVTALATWLAERALVREAVGYLRASRAPVSGTA